MEKAAGKNEDNRIRWRDAGEGEVKGLCLRHKDVIKKVRGIQESIGGDRPKQVFDVEREVVLEGKKLWLGIRKL